MLSSLSPVRRPPLVGAKKRVRSHAEATASVAPQVDEAMMKSPLMEVLWIESGTPPLFVSTRSVVGEFRPTPMGPKLTEEGLSDTPAGASPLPESATICVLN